MFQQSNPRFISLVYYQGVKFDDDILGDKDRPHEESEGGALDRHVTKVCDLIINAASPDLYPTKLVAALSPMIKRLTMKQLARRRRHKKRLMLFHSAWRERVLSQLGGKPALDKWFKHHARLLKYGVMQKGMARNKRPELSVDEQARRARIKICAQASANPQIIRDLCKMDFEGEFRLAPLPRCAVPLKPASTQPDWKIERDRNRRYDYNPIAVRYPDMLSSPTHVTGFDFIWAEQAEADEAAYQETLRVRKHVQRLFKRVKNRVQAEKRRKIKLRQFNLNLETTQDLETEQPFKTRPYNRPKIEIRIRDPAMRPNLRTHDFVDTHQRS